MKKFILAILMLCLLLTFTACKKNTSETDSPKNEGEESAQVEETLELQLEEGEEAVIAPD